jgi:hypothetical protein
VRLLFSALPYKSASITVAAALFVLSDAKTFSDRIYISTSDFTGTNLNYFYLCCVLHRHSFLPKSE